jgi:hypothetical protein
VPKAKRDYRAEYARRIARAATKRISRSQARGHPKPTEAALSSKRPPRPIEDDRLQVAFKVLRQEKSLTAAARAAKISPERLRHFATERDIIERLLGDMQKDHPEPQNQPPSELESILHYLLGRSDILESHLWDP